jgi:hypothetical protein
MIMLALPPVDFEVGKERFVWLEAIHQPHHLGGIPLIGDSAPHAVSPSGVRVVSREQSAFQGLPAVSNRMCVVRLQSKRGADLRRVQ